MCCLVLKCHPSPAVKMISGRPASNGSFHNPLNPKIKIEILIYCPYTFSIEVVGRIIFDNDDMESSKRPR